jgi:hypothetical protein
MDAHARAIMRFITAEEHDETVKDAIAFVMEGIQSSMVMAKLPEKLLRIMNMWARTGWRDHNGEVKFEHCLWKVVAREMQKRVFAFLVERSREEMCMPDEDEFACDHALTNVMRALEGLAWVDGYWPTLGAELADEAERWVTEYHEHFLIEGGDGGRFQYYDCVNEKVCYHMPHRLDPAEYEERDYEDEETGEEEEEEETGWVCVGPGTLVPC